jgi:hypothetical protein
MHNPRRWPGRVRALRGAARPGQSRSALGGRQTRKAKRWGQGFPGSRRLQKDRNSLSSKFVVLMGIDHTPSSTRTELAERAKKMNNSSCSALRRLSRRHRAWLRSWLHWREKLFLIEARGLYSFWAASSDAAQQALGRSPLPAGIRSQAFTLSLQVPSDPGPDRWTDSLLPSDRVGRLGRSLATRSAELEGRGRGATARGGLWPGGPDLSVGMLLEEESSGTGGGWLRRRSTAGGLGGLGQCCRRRSGLGHYSTFAELPFPGRGRGSPPGASPGSWPGTGGGAIYYSIHSVVDL